MGKLSEFVNKGVRLIVVDPNPEPALEPDLEAEPEPDPPAPRSRVPPPPIPQAAAPAPTAVGRARGRQMSPEVAEAAPPNRVARSEVASDVEDFTPVYKEAGITLPPHGYGVDRVSEMLQGKRLASLAREVRATAALEAARVDVQDVIQDGVRRDKALDAFEAAKERELVERKAANETRMQSLRKDLDELNRKINTEIESLKQQSQEAEAAFQQLQIRKRKEEARLHDVVAHFVEGANPITTGPGGSGPADPAAR